jgi:hypothetical protein
VGVTHHVLRITHHVLRITSATSIRIKGSVVLQFSWEDQVDETQMDFDQLHSARSIGLAVGGDR